jgi:ABC-type transport system involved in multi-copper enzyme maturation permease subunit
MTALVAADLLKLRRRNGLWWTTLLLPPAVIVLAFLLAATQVANLDGGAKFVQDGTDVLAYIAPVLAVLVGARQGSDEHATGTLRYQLLTGIPRHRLLLSKLAVVAITCAALAVLGALSVTVCGFLLTTPQGGESVAGADILDALWNTFVPCMVFGTIAFGVGSLMNNTGPAIAVALVLNILGVNLLAVFIAIDHSLRYVVLTLGIDRLTFNAANSDDRISLGGAIVVTIVWPAAFAVAGWLRLRRLEA